MKNVVVSQPMFIPWIGIFEQIALADTFYHYIDVKYPKGRSFMSRVQLLGTSGQQWLTAPIDKNTNRGLISEVLFQQNTQWKSKHLRTIDYLYSSCKFYNEMKTIVDDIYNNKTFSLVDFNIYAIERISSYLRINCNFKLSSDLNLNSCKSKRLHEICLHENADVYITGHGALNYLDHVFFENDGIEVKYMKYECIKYDQRHKPFTPFVSIIDLIANNGPSSTEYLCSGAVSKETLKALNDDK